VSQTRAEAFALLCSHTPSESLRRHCLSVETCLRWYARLLGQDEELWGIVGLLHDFDYEQHPEEHPEWGMSLLREQGWNDEVIDAIASHADWLGVPRDTPLKKHLFACDELTGFIAAVTYVRPTKSIHDVDVRSVVKKLKDKAFAAAVSREDVRLGAELIGLSLENHIDNMLTAMKSNAEVLGLSGVGVEGE
jgi:putative nucleotidyltransferase with HDIG domain